MRRNPVIHIGFHKTGTSWFQSELYPLVSSHRLADRDLVRSTFMGGDAFHFDALKARQSLEESAAGLPLLICEEDLSGTLHIGAASTYIAKVLAGRLHESFPDAQIVIFVRAQPDAAASWYAQYVREGGTASPRRYFFPDEFLFPGRNMPFKIARFDFSQLDFLGLIEEYDRLFGRERVHVFAYEELASDPSRVLAGLRSIGLDFPEELPMTRVNAAYRKRLILFARATALFTGRSVVNKRTILHLPFWFKGRLRLLNLLDRSRLFGARIQAADVLDEETKAWISYRFSPSNQSLQERMGIDLRPFGYPLAPTENDPGQPRRPRWIRWTRK